MLVAAVALAACSPAAPALTTPAPSATVSPSATPTPEPSLTPSPTGMIFTPGAYQIAITAQDAPPHPASLNGTWVDTFNPDGTFAISLGGEAVVSGTYAVSGGEITLAETGGRLACFHDTEAWRSATYHWSTGSGGLILTDSADPCPGRKLALTAHPLSPHE